MVTQEQDIVFMQRCLEIAKAGMGYVAPNPMVGAVIVYDNRIIAEGYHKAFGQAHAEVNAIKSVKDNAILRKSTLYVNLEPCSHMGKTPPCSDLIIGKKIPRVVIGTIDPNSLVSGKGISKLANSQVTVKSGIHEKECRELNKRFFTFHEKNRPYVILKWAQTTDGYIDKIRKSGEDIGVNWISNPISRTLVHKWRAEEQAIMAGTNTIITDNPKLNVRYWKGSSPIRIILDQNLRIPQSANIYDKSSYTLIFNSRKSERIDNIEFIRIDFKKDVLPEILSQLYTRDIISVLVEGGKELLESLIKENLWDEARVFIGDKNFTSGLEAPQINKPYRTDYLIKDEIRYYTNK